jgi:HAMP domain-containing protein
MVHVSSDEETPVEDASEEIQRLNTMVNEMREIVKRHSTVILDEQ